ncbi:BrnT family toxin [Blastomonas sp.]|uniref:BrnT family toxin n=1 Tax=Blastomonas sp. TaxID=1909299 RepID=UPI00391B3B0E
MAFELDNGKDMINREKHGLPLAMGIQVFEAQFIEEEDKRFAYEETRFIATGPVSSLDDRICVVVYTWRGTDRRLISFRKANDREIAKYRQSHPGVVG